MPTCPPHSAPIYTLNVAKDSPFLHKLTVTNILGLASQISTVSIDYFYFIYILKSYS